MLATILVFLVTAATIQLEAAEIDCEMVDRLEKFEKCCYLNGTTAINEVNVTFTGLEMLEVIALNFEKNEKIEFLPVKVYKKFSSLEAYLAKKAAIKEISAANFRGLSNLKFLDLFNNKIEVVPDDCFRGLTKLLRINLEWNQIKTMNGLAFANLPQLIIVQLYWNDCISRSFQIGRGSNNFIRKISRNCGSDDVARKQVSCSASSVFCLKIDCCELEYYTYIIAPDYTFVADSSYATVHTLTIVDQPYIDYLPLSLHESFPNLVEYRVINTAVRKLSKKNFEKMDKLKILYLDRNQIEVIKRDTFEDLVNLKILIINNEDLFASHGPILLQLQQLGRIGGILFVNDTQFVEVACEKFIFFGQSEYCMMDDKTVINATNFVVAEWKDEQVKGITFEYNKDIKYIPYKVYMQFPNLERYLASECSIKAISHENFEKLSKLQEIDLSQNEIQKISTNIFEGLESLKKVDLSENQIKSINGRIFDHLPLLTYVDLTENECIDDNIGPFYKYKYKNQALKALVHKHTMTQEGKKFDITADLCPDQRQKNVMKNFTRNIIQNCAFTEPGEREFEKVFDIKCGVGKGGEGYIVGGNETKRGQWPFMAALFYVDKAEGEPTEEFFCGGNVITASHVLTAAHCIQNKYAERPLKPSEIAILLGRYNISRRAEVGSETRRVKSIKVHPNWSPSESKFGGDVAVLEMDRAVQFSELIQPVCVTVEQELSQLEAGYVVGWGKSESYAPHETVPRQVLISSVTAEVCFVKDYKLGAMFDQGMYCAGGDGAGPCLGDSGGGFFVKYYGLWTLRGIVSSGITNTGGGCKVNGYTLFTSVLDYTSWIGDAIEKNATLKLLSSGNPQYFLTLNDSEMHSNDDSTPEPTATNAAKKYYRVEYYLFTAIFSIKLFSLMLLMY